MVQIRNGHKRMLPHWHLRKIKLEKPSIKGKCWWFIKLLHKQRETGGIEQREAESAECCVRLVVEVNTNTSLPCPLLANLQPMNCAVDPFYWHTVLCGVRITQGEN